MKDPNCIFCKIANGGIPSHTIYEDDHFRGFLDVSPATRGHALIIPKEHYANLLETPEDVVKDAVSVARDVAGRIKERLGADGFHLVQNNGPAAGQTVFHFHLHIIPRYEGDHADILWKPTTPPEDELKEICEKINEG